MRHFGPRIKGLCLETKPIGDLCTMKLLKIFVPLALTVACVVAGTVTVQEAKPERPLDPGIIKYDGTITAGEQNIQFPIVTEIRKIDGGYRATETAMLRGTELVDECEISEGTLAVTKRLIKQGPMTIEIAFDQKSAKGKISANGKTTSYEAPLTGWLFADGAGTFEVFGTLPLKAGYSATFRNFDTNKQKETLKQISVVGEEKVTVPAGDFEAFKIEVTSEGDNPVQIWVDKNSRRMVKVTSILKNMGGATLTTVMVK